MERAHHFPNVVPLSCALAVAGLVSKVRPLACALMSREYRGPWYLVPVPRIVNSGQRITYVRRICVGAESELLWIEHLTAWKKRTVLGIILVAAACKTSFTESSGKPWIHQLSPVRLAVFLSLLKSRNRRFELNMQAFYFCWFLGTEDYWVFVKKGLVKDSYIYNRWFDPSRFCSNKQFQNLVLQHLLDENLHDKLLDATPLKRGKNTFSEWIKTFFQVRSKYFKSYVSLKNGIWKACPLPMPFFSPTCMCQSWPLYPLAIAKPQLQVLNSQRKLRPIVQVIS